MFPEWIGRILESLGLPGAIIFVLLLTIAALVAYVKSMQAKADKVYGYRLGERDTLTKTLSDTAQVLQGVLEATDERNEITEEQADLIAKQAQAFELLKVTILAQYDNIRDHNTAAAMAVTAMADAIRQLSSMVVENRAISTTHVTNVQGSMNDLKTELVKAVRDAGDATVRELRTLLGGVTRIEHRKKSP